MCGPVYLEAAIVRARMRMAVVSLARAWHVPTMASDDVPMLVAARRV